MWDKTTHLRYGNIAIFSSEEGKYLGNTFLGFVRVWQPPLPALETPEAMADHSASFVLTVSAWIKDCQSHERASRGAVSQSRAF